MASTGEAWRLGRRPALDGLRGIAILLVIASHTRAPFVPRPAGQVGVTVFFVLSGFLIATLLCQELESTGRLSFRHFYERRARRLLPALFAVVATSVAVSLAVGIPFVTWAEVLGALTYSTNVIGLFSPIQDHGMLHHTWSLVIEEQFYLVWPAIIVCLWRRRVLLLAASVAVALIITFHRVAMADGSVDLERLAFSIDTRADGILIGCALALYLRSREPRASRLTAWIGVVWIAAVIGAPLMVVLTLGLTLASIATCLVILSAVADSAPGWLSWRPLVAIGKVSYGLYLWHHLVLVFTDRALGWRDDWVATTVVLLPVSAALTYVSWRFLESPWLHPGMPTTSLDPPPANGAPQHFRGGTPEPAGESL